uniref:Chemocyanin n=1 Tax=Aegilops tauschii TaxID=37682 RepID=R7VZ04_AEGTA
MRGWRSRRSSPSATAAAGPSTPAPGPTASASRAATSLVRTPSVSKLFNYDPTAHDVVAVSAEGYRACAAPSGAKVYKSGADRVTLALGPNYFISSVPGDCQAGMKITVTAAKQGRIGGAS